MVIRQNYSYQNGGKIMEEIFETLKNVNNEGTRAPYWVILDPSQNMTDRKSVV